MRVDELIVEGKKVVHSDHAKMILADLLDVNTLELYNILDREVSDEVKNIYLEKVNALSSNKPLQYVIGNVNFYGLKLKVCENVLIPRFETEELVENTIKLIKEHFSREELNIIDLGCGSGAIGLALKSKLNNSNITLLDISSDAINLASENATSLDLDVKFIENDMLDGIEEKFDVIISNPPYIKDDEEIEEIVRDNEPHLALFAGKDGLDCYKKIINNVKKNLNDDFLLAFEIGYQQKDDIIKLINNNFDNVDIITKKDLSLKDRMIFVMNKK